jgi:hydrogenase nickel incorporation protein HypA/HybF
MHELPITERILDVVLRHAAGQDVRRIVRVHLRVGALSDLEDHWIQHYFNYLSRGTLAGNAELAITRAPIRVRCRACTHTFQITRDDLGKASCPDCGATESELVSGREYFIENMEVL